MTSIKKFCFLNLILLSSTPVIAEVELSVSPTSSGRLYADYSFGDCCTLDAWSSNSSSSTLWTETCEIMGGYCMGGKDVAKVRVDASNHGGPLTRLSGQFDKLRIVRVNTVPRGELGNFSKRGVRNLHSQKTEKRLSRFVVVATLRTDEIESRKRIL